jgi:hypothetical protein
MRERERERDTPVWPVWQIASVYPKVECARCVSKTVALSERESKKKRVTKKVINERNGRKILQKNALIFLHIFYISLMEYRGQSDRGQKDRGQSDWGTK